MKVLGDGTKLSGFVKAAKNMPPRECHACQWYKNDSCGHPVVMLDPELENSKLENGRISVEEHDCCNFFQSKKSVLLYALRHGDTELNESNQFRGWVDVPLSDNGREQAKKAGEFLQDKGISAILCSPLIRAVETAEIVASFINVDPDDILKLSRLLPWNVGYLSGKDKDEYAEDLERFIDNPSEEIPEGESLKSFADRFREGFEGLVEDYLETESNPILIVTHTSDIVQIEQFAKGEENTARPEEVDSVNPGGILEFGKMGDKYFSEPVFGKYHEGEYGS